MNFLVQIGIGLASTVIGYLMQPKPEDTTRKARVEDFEMPTAEPGRVMPVLFGTVIIKDSNILHAGERGMEIRHVRTPKK